MIFFVCFFCFKKRRHQKQRQQLQRQLLQRWLQQRKHFCNYFVFFFFLGIFPTIGILLEIEWHPTIWIFKNAQVGPMNLNKFQNTNMSPTEKHKCIVSQTHCTCSQSFSTNSGYIHSVIRWAMLSLQICDQYVKWNHWVRLG